MTEPTYFVVEQPTDIEVRRRMSARRRTMRDAYARLVPLIVMLFVGAAGGNDRQSVRKRTLSSTLYENIEKENATIRKGLIDVLTGQKSIRVAAGAPRTETLELPSAATAMVTTTPKD
jgi:hypothetical protein